MKNLLKLFLQKIKAIQYYFYNNMYTMWQYVYTTVFKGPLRGLGFFSEDLNHETISEKREIYDDEPRFIVNNILNVGFWHIYNQGFWLGSRLWHFFPKIEVLESNLMEIKDKEVNLNKKKRYKKRALYMHNSFYRKLLLLRLSFYLIIIEFLFSLNFGIIIAIILIPFFYFINFVLFHIFSKLFKINILELFMKPLIFETSMRSIPGTLYDEWSQNLVNYFIVVRELFFDKLYYITYGNKYNNIFKSFNKEGLVKKNSKIPYNYFKNFDNKIDLLKSLNSFWKFSDKSSEKSYNQNFNMINHRLIFFKKLKNKYYSLFLIFLLKVRTRGLHVFFEKNVRNHLFFLNLVIHNASIYEYFLFFFFKMKSLLFIIFLLLLTFFFDLSFFLTFIIILFYILYFFIEFLILCKSGNLKKHICDNIIDFFFYKNITYEKFFFYFDLKEKGYNLNELICFNWFDYKLFLKLETNISTFENTLNTILTEQEILYKMCEGEGDNVIRNKLVNILFYKYFLLFSNSNLISYKDLLKLTKNEKISDENIKLLNNYLKNFKKGSYGFLHRTKLPKDYVMDQYFNGMKNTVKLLKNRQLNLENININLNLKKLEIEGKNLNNVQCHYFFKYGIKLLK